MANAVSGLTRAQYSGLDFDTHQDDIRGRIQAKFAAVYNDFAVASLGIMLIDVISFGLDTLSFYLDRRTTDTYLPTARTRKSISRLCRQLGYRMRGAVASSVTLQVTPDSLAPIPFTLPKGFQFQGPDETIFEVADDVPFSSIAEKDVLAYEGETFTESFVSDGTANQVFELRSVPEDKYVVDGSVKVTVDGVEFDENDFITFEATDQYEAGLNDDPPTIRFGDGVAGNIPVLGADIVVEYVATFGKAGQVSADTIDDVVTSLVVGTTTVELTVTNEKGAVGGDDAEDLEHAKIYAARVWKSRLVAVTKGDYEALAGSYADPLYGRVSVAKALSARSADLDLDLQNNISLIKTLVLGVVSPIETSLTAANSGLDQVDTDLATILTALNNTATKVAAIKTDADTAISSSRTAKNKTQEISTDANDIKNEVTDGKAEVDAITTGSPSVLTSADKSAIKAYFDNIDAEAGTIVSSAASVGAEIDSAVSTLGSQKDKADDVGTAVSEGYLEEIADARTSIVTEVGAIGSPSTGIREDLEDIQTEVDKIDTANGVSSQVNTALDFIFNHVDALLSHDCKANLVSVPILTKDANGFYTAPTTGLIQSLQNYLDQRKEVTQTVVVTSGEDFLVSAVLVIRLGVKYGYAESSTQTAVEAVVDGLLKDRKFGASLYVEHVYKAINEQVEGLAFHNVTISGPSAKLDANGNLVIEKSEVVTKGTVTYTTEVVEEE